MLALIQSFLMYKGYKSIEYSNKRSDLSTSWSMQNELQRLIYNLQKIVLIFKSGILATIPLCLGSSTSTTWGAPDFLSERNQKKKVKRCYMCVEF